jgi:antitoxin (DNA-binding transcriptional repressor) of toxin-antitoxin stability system
VKTITVTEAARSFSNVLERLERDQEGVVLMRKDRRVARIVPEAASQTALEVLGDLYGTLDDKTAENLSRAIEGAGTGSNSFISELKDPWGS